MNKRLWWVVGGIVVVVLIVLAVKNSGTSPDLYGSPSPSASASPSPSASTSGTSTSSVKAYTALVTQYGANRIQFDAYCQAIPKIAVFKTGTKVMFDNRSGDARIITIGGTKYSFPGYGYRIIKLGSSTLPATVNLDCGSAIHVGTITVEK